MAKLHKYSGKEFRIVNGKKYQFRFAFPLKSEADKKVKLLRQEGRKVRVVHFEGGYGLFMIRKSDE